MILIVLLFMFFLTGTEMSALKEKLLEGNKEDDGVKVMKLFR